MSTDGRLYRRIRRDDVLGLVAFGLLSHDFLIEWDRDRLLGLQVD